MSLNRSTGQTNNCCNIIPAKHTSSLIWHIFNLHKEVVFCGFMWVVMQYAALNGFLIYCVALLDDEFGWQFFCSWNIFSFNWFVILGIYFLNAFFLLSGFCVSSGYLHILLFYGNFMILSYILLLRNFLGGNMLKSSNFYKIS